MASREGRVYAFILKLLTGYESPNIANGGRTRNDGKRSTDWCKVLINGSEIINKWKCEYELML